MNDAALAAVTDPEAITKVDWGNQKWQTIIEKQPLHAHRRHFYHLDKIVSVGPWTHVKITIFPDGGISPFSLPSCMYRDISSDALCRLGVSRLRVIGYLHEPSAAKL